MSGMQGVRVGMSAYGLDDQLLGAVDAVDDESVSIGGTRVLAEMVRGVAGDRVEINYTKPQFLWQGSPADEKDDAVSYDAAGAGELAERMDRGELPTAPELEGGARFNR